MMSNLETNLLQKDDALQTKLVGCKRPLNLASSLSLDNNCTDIDPLPTKRRKVSVDSSWDLKEVPELPYLYLKEKTSVVVMNENPQDIATRIVHCAKGLSIYGYYNGAKGKASLKVDNMEFCVQLFKVTTEKTNKCVIVEIQRLNGSPLKFHNVARIMLEAAKNKINDKKKAEGVTSRSFSSSKFNLNLLRYHGSKSTKKVNDIKNNNTEINHEQLLTCTLEMVDALLKKDRADANLLGMESLQLLTTYNSTSDAMVDFVSHVILSGEKFSEIKERIMSLIGTSTHPEDDDDDDDNGSIEEDQDPRNLSSCKLVEDGYQRKMRLCAITALGNSLEHQEKQCKATKSSEASTFDSIISMDDWIGDGDDDDDNNGLLLHSLLHQLKKAKTCPEEAYLAGKCLDTVFRMSLRIRDSAVKHGANLIVRESSKIGHESYPSLEYISNKILDVLGVDAK